MYSSRVIPVTQPPRTKMYRDKTFARPKNKSLYSCHFLLHKVVGTKAKIHFLVTEHPPVEYRIIWGGGGNVDPKERS